MGVAKGWEHELWNEAWFRPWFRHFLATRPSRTSLGLTFLVPQRVPQQPACCENNECSLLCGLAIPRSLPSCPTSSKSHDVSPASCQLPNRAWPMCRRISRLGLPSRGATGRMADTTDICSLHSSGGRKSKIKVPACSVHARPVSSACRWLSFRRVS